MPSDEIGDLSGPVEIERVIDGSETRTYDKKGVEVLILDGLPDSVGDAFVAHCELEFENPVPVVRDERGKEIIGTAVLYRQGKSLLADLFLRYDSEERLVLETGGKLYPGVAGAITGAELSDGLVHKRIVSARIQRIGLHIASNVDPRISPV
jgi:hypothetical protein